MFGTLEICSRLRYVFSWYLFCYLTNFDETKCNFRFMRCASPHKRGEHVYTLNPFMLVQLHILCTLSCQNGLSNKKDIIVYVRVLSPPPHVQMEFSRPWLSETPMSPELSGIQLAIGAFLRNSRLKYVTKIILFFLVML